jgi:hypothetical protein
LVYLTWREGIGAIPLSADPSWDRQDGVVALAVRAAEAQPGTGGLANPTDRGGFER